MNAYLVEVRSTGGLSGSPIFVKETIKILLLTEADRLTISRETTGPGVAMQGEGEGYLLGMAQGHWEIDPKDRNNVIIGTRGKEESINLGIALVVPAYVIRETLYQDELVAMRKQAEEDRQREEGTTTIDSGIAFPPTQV
jgi:hypothetical protein